MPRFSDLYKSLEQYLKEQKCQKHSFIAINVKAIKSKIIEEHMCHKCGHKKEIILSY